MLSIVMHWTLDYYRMDIKDVSFITHLDVVNFT